MILYRKPDERRKGPSTELLPVEISPSSSNNETRRIGAAGGAVARQWDRRKCCKSGRGTAAADPENKLNEERNQRVEPPPESWSLFRWSNYQNSGRGQTKTGGGIERERREQGTREWTDSTRRGATDGWLDPTRAMFPNVLWFAASILCSARGNFVSSDHGVAEGVGKGEGVEEGERERGGRRERVRGRLGGRAFRLRRGLLMS